jgi:hypothetical protein
LFRKRERLAKSGYGLKAVLLIGIWGPVAFDRWIRDQVPFNPWIRDPGEKSRIRNTAKRLSAQKQVSKSPKKDPNRETKKWKRFQDYFN